MADNRSNNIMNSSKFVLRKSSTWTVEENREFELALAEIDPNALDFVDILAARIPTKTREHVAKHFRDLIIDIRTIENGLIELPVYESIDKMLPSQVSQGDQPQLQASAEAFPSAEPQADGANHMQPQLRASSVELIPSAEPQADGADHTQPQLQASSAELVPSTEPQADGADHSQPQLQASSAELVPSVEFQAGDTDHVQPLESQPQASQMAMGSRKPRKKGIPWSEEEHKKFLEGLDRYGRGNWRYISKYCVRTRTPSQVASHSQKYFEKVERHRNKGLSTESFHITGFPGASSSYVRLRNSKNLPPFSSASDTMAVNTGLNIQPSLNVPNLESHGPCGFMQELPNSDAPGYSIQATRKKTGLSMNVTHLKSHGPPDFIHVQPNNDAPGYSIQASLNTTGLSILASQNLLNSNKHTTSIMQMQQPNLVVSSPTNQTSGLIPASWEASNLTMMGCNITMANNEASFFKKDKASGFRMLIQQPSNINSQAMDSDSIPMITESNYGLEVSSIADRRASKSNVRASQLGTFWPKGPFSNG